MAPSRRYRGGGPSIAASTKLQDIEIAVPAKVGAQTCRDSQLELHVPAQLTISSGATRRLVFRVSELGVIKRLNVPETLSEWDSLVVGLQPRTGIYPEVVPVKH